MIITCKNCGIDLSNGKIICQGLLCVECYEHEKARKPLDWIRSDPDSLWSNFGPVNSSYQMKISYFFILINLEGWNLMPLNQRVWVKSFF